MDEDWRAIRQAINKGVGEEAWESLYCKFVEMNTEINVRNPSGSSGVKTLWAIRDAREMRHVL